MATATVSPKLGGPKTPEGKAISSQNALKHGLFSKNLILESESQSDFDALLGDYTRRYQPLGISEQDLVFEVAVNRFRIRRAWFYETAIMEYEPPAETGEMPGEKTNPSDLDERARIAISFGADKDKAKAISLIHRYEARLRRSYERALKELSLLRELRGDQHFETHVQPQPAPPAKQPTPVSSATTPEPPAHTSINPEILRSTTDKDVRDAVRQYLNAPIRR